MPAPARPQFAWILPIRIIIFPLINADIFLPLILYDNALIQKRSLILSNTNTKIWSKKWVWVLMYLKCFFSNPGRWRFLVVLVYDTKMSKLILCFSILLLKISWWVKKNLTRLSGGNRLTSCINAQLVMINLLDKWAETLLWTH